MEKVIFSETFMFSTCVKVDRYFHPQDLDSWWREDQPSRIRCVSTSLFRSFFRSVSHSLNVAQTPCQLLRIPAVKSTANAAEPVNLSLAKAGKWQMLVFNSAVGLNVVKTVKGALKVFTIGRTWFMGSLLVTSSAAVSIATASKFTESSKTLLFYLFLF